MGVSGVGGCVRCGWMYMYNVYAHRIHVHVLWYNIYTYTYMCSGTSNKGHSIITTQYKKKGTIYSSAACLDCIYMYMCTKIKVCTCICTLHTLLNVQPTLPVSFSHSNIFQNGYGYFEFREPLIHTCIHVHASTCVHVCMGIHVHVHVI